VQKAWLEKYRAPFRSGAGNLIASPRRRVGSQSQRLSARALPRRVWFSSAAVLLLLLLCAALCRAEDIKKLKPTGYVDDFAGVLTEASRQKISALCSEVREKTGAQISVVTINSLDGGDIDDYANRLFAQWGIGGKGNNNGVLILFAIQDHKYRTEVGYGLEPILPDGKVGGFGREAVSLLRQDNYDAAAYLMARRVAEVIAADKGVTLSSPGAETPRDDTERGRSRTGIPIGLVFFLIWGLFSLINRFRPASSTAARRRRGSSWWIWPFLGGGFGGGGFGGGGFGGGGGGFGGFGGGMSGGGGASGSW
jgi:uncharacterized protein